MQLSSIIKKVVMALTGWLLIGFLVAHLMGNFLLLQGSERYDAYSAFLEHNPLLLPAEVALVLIFVVHVYLAVQLSWENMKARPTEYALRQTGGQSVWASRNMLITGLITVIFVVVHIWQFKYGTRPEHSLWQLVVSSFQNPTVVVFYLLCLALIGLHLSHGIGSTFQSLGLRSHSGRPRLLGASPALAFLLAAGFASLPLWVFLTSKRSDVQTFSSPKIDQVVPASVPKPRPQSTSNQSSTSSLPGE
ncbi:MAG TPA: succinate dehydrogenase cytochrome b subunit [Planctomycetota bacterium]|jgi:succinate dehydrogenase / fumarate reductase cytochrome b subunit